MQGAILRSSLVAAVLAVALTAAAPLPAAPPGGSYTVTPLVSDQPGVAPTTDPNLVNAWGLARGATSPWWVADNEADKTTVYNSVGVLQMIGGQPFQVVEGGPTGAVFSGIAGNFQVGTTASPTTLAPANFIFASSDRARSRLPAAWYEAPRLFIVVSVSGWPAPSFAFCISSVRSSRRRTHSGADN